MYYRAYLHGGQTHEQRGLWRGRIPLPDGVGVLGPDPRVGQGPRGVIFGVDFGSGCWMWDGDLNAYGWTWVLIGSDGWSDVVVERTNGTGLCIQA